MLAFNVEPITGNLRDPIKTLPKNNSWGYPIQLQNYILFIIAQSQLWKQIIIFMVKGSIFLSAPLPKNAEQKQRIRYRDTCIRYVVMILAILTVFCFEYCFDLPSALEEYIEDSYKYKQGEELREPTFNLLYSFYSFPNIIIPLIGGMLIDKIGTRIVFIMACTLCVIGQLVFSFAGLHNMFILMLVGRTIFGMGGQVVHGAQGTIISNWFKPHELSLVLGICISVPNLGSELNSYLSPIIANHFDDGDPNNFKRLGYPMFVGFFAICLGLVCTVILWVIDRQTELRQRQIHESALLSHIIDKPYKKSDTSPLKGQDSLKKQYSSVVVDNQGEKQGEAVEGEHINLKDILKLPPVYWLLIIQATLAYSLFVPFIDNGNKYYVQVFKGIDGPQEASIYMVVPYVVSALLVPPLGYFAEKVRRRSYLIIINSFFFFLTYLCMLFFETNSHLRGEEFIRWIPVTLMGVGIGMFCSVIVPTLPMLISDKQLGTAFGLMEILMNLFLGLVPLIIGAIRDSVEDNELQGFHLQTMFLFLLSCLMLGMSFMLKSVDLVTGNKIDKKDFSKHYIREVLQETA